MRRAAPDIVQDRIDRALADDDAPASTPLMRVCAENGTNVAPQLRHVAAADPVFLLGQHDDRAALRGFVGQRGELRRVGELLLGDAADRTERRRLAVAERDGAGLVEQQGIDVAGGLDRRPESRAR